MMERELIQRWIAGNGVRLHVVTSGGGPPVILLHGFPENWHSWHRQISPLVAAGFSVWAPDLRGYNLSDRPWEKSAYELDDLVADVVALVKATGYPRAHIVGHDWGGIIAWAIAEHFPALVNRLVILNAPHLKLYLEKVKCPRQMLRSWYVLFFQMPKLPEFALAAGNFRAVRHMFRLSPHVKTAFSDSDIENYIQGLSQPGALTASLNYYRANLTRASIRAILHMQPVYAETAIIWGEQDPALGIELLEGIDRVAPRNHIYRIPNSSHWVQNEAPDEVNGILVDFLGKS
jgi:pimeloyl-ACP methyl ester carboxylesterase